jgi:hypothetical protein
MRVIILWLYSTNRKVAVQFLEGCQVVRAFFGTVRIAWKVVSFYYFTILQARQIFFLSVVLKNVSCEALPAVKNRNPHRYSFSSKRGYQDLSRFSVSGWYHV